MHGVPNDAATKKFVWDTSALLNIKEPNGQGYSPGHSFYKDFSLAAQISSISLVSQAFAAAT